MACYKPIRAYQRKSGGPLYFKNPVPEDRMLDIPCGQCIGCRLDKSYQWAVRCMHEASMYDCSSFVTLTYDDKYLPKFGQLRYRDYQLFMKRLIKKKGPVRMFMCGEYGEYYRRPHYHAILFGVHFEDRVLSRKSSSGFNLYRSSTLDSLWKLGFCEIGDVTLESAGYCARYTTKKLTGEAEVIRLIAEPDFITGEVYMNEDGEQLPLVPEFGHMSLKPGIGAEWFKKYKSDVFPEDSIILKGGNGVKVPRYYDKLLLKDGPSDFFHKVREKRYERAMNCLEDSTKERLRVREIVARAGVDIKNRSI